jgi:hypothetical protein
MNDEHSEEKRAERELRESDRDVTEQRNVENQLRAATKSYEQLFETVPYGIPRVIGWSATPRASLSG